ncbi:helix-turn-helix domain-containing protein [Clostridioides sp. ZZV14-6150]|uniref:helix-turn-helix domain-containing protein n=1 Tax=unclassified Clostridioides TaxID=2635829 RepID=UPI001D11C024|nr:helix-turn-helix domain-containing protein [Clostridioides sp. ZZV14-6150]MCC0721641.1 helix-turn-helix domain-containing protein [Clostridioides sp. ZZV14-6104]MCC0733511.1 helix-turn-helix domain-containing protein [Clostridioides sp. ZZV14-6009]MCC0750164.1 helix-turn-helix domain-containing protein [Clostridioides sp. ZZV13-5731]
MNNLKRTALGYVTYEEYNQLLSALSQKAFLNVKETSVYFGVSVSRVYEMIKQNGELFTVKFSHGATAGYKIDSQRFQDYIRKNGM